MPFCVNCGKECREDYSFCVNCGHPLNQAADINESIDDGELNNDDESVVTEEDFNSTFNIEKNSEEPVEIRNGFSITGSPGFAGIKDGVRHAAEKTASSASSLAGQIGGGLSKMKTEHVDKKTENNKKETLSSREKAVKQAAKRDDILSTTELWSWLKKDSKRQIFYNEEENNLSEKDFADLVQKKLVENDVQANIEEREIEWDRNSEKKKCMFIKPVTDAADPVSYILQFNHVGKFSFVEEKTFITPPDLPPVPGNPVKPRYSAQMIAKYLLYAIVAFIIGIVIMNTGFLSGVGIPLIIVGIILFVISFGLRGANQSDLEHNRKCAREKAEWNRVWDNWNNTIFLHSFQEDTNGQLSRIYEASFECVKQVSEDIFKGKKVQEDEETNKMSELESMISRRRNEYR